MRKQIIKGALVQAALFMFLSLQAQQPEPYVEILSDIEGINVEDMQITPNGEIVICGSLGGRPAIVKTDTLGNFLWGRNYSSGKMGSKPQQTEFNSLVADEKGNIYTLCTQHDHEPNFIVKIDSDGNIIKESEYFQPRHPYAEDFIPDLLVLNDTVIYALGGGGIRTINPTQLYETNVRDFGFSENFLRYHDAPIISNNRWWFIMSKGVGSIDTLGHDSVVLRPDLESDELNQQTLRFIAEDSGVIHCIDYEYRSWGQVLHNSYVPYILSYTPNHVIRKQNLFEFTEEMEQDTISYGLKLHHTNSKGFCGVGIERRNIHEHSKSEMFLYQGRMHDEFECLHYSFPEELNQPGFGYRYPVMLREFKGSFYFLMIASNTSTKLVKMKFPNLDEYPPVSVAEKQKTSNHNLRIYPNPSTGTFELTAEERIEHIQIFSLSGALIKEYRPADIQQQITIENPGTYLVKSYLTGGKVNVNKVVKL